MKKYLMANWKNEKSVSEAIDMLNSFVSGSFDLKKFLDRIDIIIAPPHLSLAVLSDICSKAGYSLSAQDGAASKLYGSVSMNQLAEICNTVVIGHSSARKDQQDDNICIRQKVNSALKAGLKIVLCIGESAQDRQNKETLNVLKNQLQIAFADISDFSGITILYEPVWAMGTGYALSPEEAGEIARQISCLLKELFGVEEIPVIYAGSVNPQNAALLASQPGIYGLAVGAASLDPAKFYAIADSIYNIYKE